MKKILNAAVIFIIILANNNNLFSQTTIASDNIDVPANWTLNTVVGAPVNSVVPGANQTEMLGLPTGDNRWYISNVYSNNEYDCAGFTVGASTVPAQPAAIPNNNTNYLHLIADCSIAAGEYAASWNASLEYKRRFFAYMNYDFSTSGYYSVNFSFWSLEAAGISVYYSTDGGTTWNFLDYCPSLNGNWIKNNFSGAAFDNQATLRFGFLWEDSQGGDANFPSVDALELSVPALTCSFFEDKTTICEAADDTVTFTNLSSPTDVSVTYSWSVTPGISGTDWLFVPPTTSTSKNPQIQFLTANTYSVQLTTTRSSTSESLTETDVINVISGCQCTGGGGTVELLNSDPLLSEWTLTRGGVYLQNWMAASQAGNFNAVNPAGSEAYLQIPMGVNSNGSYADMTWPTNMDFSDATASYELTFSYCNEFFSGGWGSYQNTLQIYISTNGGGAWTLIRTYNSDTGPNWVNETVDLSAYAGSGTSFRIRFRGIRSAYDDGSEGDWDMGLNDILITKTTSGGGLGDEPTATITLTEGTNPSCSGTDLEFTCTATNLGSATVSDYEWFVDGVSVQTGLSNTYSSNSLTDGQVITCAITLTGGTCDGPFTSLTYTVFIDEVLTPFVWIIADPATIVCEGTNFLFTADYLNGGTSPTFEWQLNGVTVSLTDSYSSSLLGDGDVVTVYMTSDVNCPSSNPVSNTYNVNIYDTSNVIINYNTLAACENTPTDFSVISTNGSPPYTYEWFVNGVSSGTGATFSSATLNYGDIIYLVESSATTCSGQSNSIEIMGLDPPNSLNGTYIIQSGTPFPDFTTAVNALEEYGVSGPVIFQVADEVFNEQIEIHDICGVDATNNVTFETWCDDCGNAIVEFNPDATENFIVKFNHTDYFNFNNIEFRNTGSNLGHVLDFSHFSSNLSFTNCIFNGISTALNNNELAVIFTDDYYISNLTFSKNEINNGSYGLFFTGYSSSVLNAEISLLNNNFTNQAYSGLFLVNANKLNFYQNSIITNSSRTDFRGISLITCENDINISSNIVNAISANGYGLYIDDLAGISGSEPQIINNMFAIGNGTGTSYGINIESTTGNSEYIELWFNSTNVLSTNGAAFRVNTADYLNILNNNFISASGISYDVTGLTNSTENYNNFMPDFVGKGANSISINPVYLSSTNLHTENAGLQVGNNSTGISIDIDGETRQNPPYIGADEYLGSVIWTGNTSTDWNTVTNWQPNTYISNATNVIIPTTPAGGNYPETNSATDNLAECKNITIQNGSHLYVAPDKYLTVWGELNQNGTFIIQSDATGTGSFINKGNINYGVGNTTTVERYISEAMWHYVSSPITNANVDLFLPQNFYFYDETVADSWNMQNFTGGLMGWTHPTTGSSMNVMQGYICYQNEGVVDFTGVLNTGYLSYNLSYTDNTGIHGNAVFDGWNLVGNPYPSTLNWYDNDNITKTNIDGAIYFYKDDGTGAYNNYSYFLPESYTNPYPSIVINRVSGCIPVEQSFFVKANATGASISVTDNARIHNQTEFYKTLTETPPTIRLQIDNNNKNDEIVLRFIPEATENYDGQFDAIKLIGYSTGVPYLYVIGDDGINLAISSFNIIDENTIVNLGVKLDQSNQYSIKVNELVISDSITPYLRDNYRNVNVDLRKNPEYSFYSETGIYPDRFEIWFDIKENIVNLQTVFEVPDVEIYSNKMNLFVNFKQEPYKSAQIRIFDMTGKEIKITNVSMKQNIIEMNNISEGFYNIMVIQDENITTQKVIFIRQ